MIAEPEGDLTWSPLLMIRPPVTPGDYRVRISDPLHQIHANVDVAALMDFMCATTYDVAHSNEGQSLGDELRRRSWLTDANEPDSDHILAMRQWWDYGWHPSLSYYLWSRRREYADTRDSEGHIRSDLIHRYLQSEGSPSPRTTDISHSIRLPADVNLPVVTVRDSLLKRRTARRFNQKRPVTLDQLSAVMWHSLSDIRRVRLASIDEPRHYLRSHGTAIDPYLAVMNVTGLDEGFYSYSVEHHALSLISTGNVRADLERILIGMAAPRTAAFSVILVADFPRYQWRYRHNRALRHLYMTSGRVGQRVILAAQAFGMGTLPTPAVRDGVADDALQLDPLRQAVLYTLTCGFVSTRKGFR